jgi:GDPmannose 4,6-dehydratase
MRSKVAFITGVTGQDGSYLAELLLSKGYEVHGLIRRSSTFNTSRIDHIYQDPHEPNPKLFLHFGDLIDGVGLTNLIREIKPDEVYNLGAQSHVQVSFTMPQYTGQVDAVGAVGLLEAIRSAEIDTRFYQASTSELFGSTPPPQNEESVFKPRSPYAAAKLMAYWCTVNYREGYGMHATNGILFNHESPRRGETFVTRKITRSVAEIALGSKKKLFLGNLEAIRDWGYAKEYVESMWLMMQQEKPSDYVVATGVGASVKEFAEAAFARVGLNWQDHVDIDKKYIRPTEVDALIGTPTKIEKQTGWVAKTHWKQLAELMVDADVSALKLK